MTSYLKVLLVFMKSLLVFSVGAFGGGLVSLMVSDPGIYALILSAGLLAILIYRDLL